MAGLLIVGAGPTGLTLGCELAARGVAFRLVDAAPGPFEGSRAKGVQPRTLEVFDRLGIVQAAVAAGRTDLPFRQHGADGAFVDVPKPLPPPRPDVPWPASLMIPQWRTEALLRERLTELGGRIEYGTQLVSAGPAGDQVRGILMRAGSEQAFEADWLVGCDGGRSTVRRAGGFSFLGETHEDMRMLVGDMHVEGLDREHWHLWRPPAGGLMAMAPLPGVAGTASFQVQIGIGPKTPDAVTLENFQRLADHYAGVGALRLSAPTWMSLWRANVRMVDRYRIGRVLLAGDAAHVHTPAGGQGMNTGIQDAFNLGWKLAAVQGGADEALLDSYEAERLPVARQVLDLSSRLAATATDGSTRGLVARGEDTSQLAIAYRDSPLSCELRASAGRVRAGDRAPDAPGLRDAAGRSLRLFDLLRGPRTTLLVFGEFQDTAHLVDDDALHVVRIVGPQAAPPHQAWVDTQGHFATAWEPGQAALFAVRPDGVIGLATDTPDPAALNAWLRRAGARG